MTTSDTSGLWVAFDDHWHVLDISPGAAAVAGRPPADCIGHSLWELRPIVAGRPLERALLQAAASQTPFGPSVMAGPDGQSFEVEIAPGERRTVLRARPVVSGASPSVPRERRPGPVSAPRSTSSDRRAGRDRRRSDDRRTISRRKRSR
jgi:PAS domain-containing protein